MAMNVYCWDFYSQLERGFCFVCKHEFLFIIHCVETRDLLLKKQVVEDVIVSPDSKNDTIHVKDEVENIRDAVNGDDKLPPATFLQLHETSDVRTKIKDAVGQGKYAKGSAVPGDINVRLNANKEESPLNVLIVGVDAQEGERDDGGILEPIEIGDTSTKKDLSNPKDSESHESLTPSEKSNVADSWFKHRLQLKEKQGGPILLKEPTINTVLQLPIWFNLRRGFVRNFFAVKKN